MQSMQSMQSTLQILAADKDNQEGSLIRTSRVKCPGPEGTELIAASMLCTVA